MSDLNQQKKLMRIALVGVRPADQVTLKGYFRVLLRLDVDLEWVSATDSNVHLFVVNDEFRSASSVVKLIENNAGTPVLYMDRTDLGDGGLKQNLLTLPLKQIGLLNEWLTNHVAILTKDGAVQSVSTPSRQAQSAPAANKAHVETANFKDVIELIKTLQAKHQSLYEIVDNGEVVAVIDNGKQLAWVIGTPKINLSWRLRPYTGNAKDSKMAIDLTQWLWQTAWQNPQHLLRLVNDTDKHQLCFWIKPTQIDRRDLLQIMTAMEREPVNVVEIAGRAKVSVLTAKKAVTAFLVSGVLQPTSYQSLFVPTAAEVPAVSIDVPPEPQPQPQPTSPQQEEKMGFLGRLRRKLGL